MSKKYVYLLFKNEANASMRELLGGKGANLAEMFNIGLPVPPAFTVTTEACTRYYDDGKKIGQDIIDEIDRAIPELETVIGKKFGDPKNPLLVSVRSGSRASMPGMMDTILNLGMNDEVAEGLAKLTGNPRFAYDSYRRFIQMFADVVMDLGKSYFEKILKEVKAQKGVELDKDLTASDLQEIVALYKAEYRKLKNEAFPQDPHTQLIEAVKAVFRSWDNPRANIYRMREGIPYSWGTAVNVQCMVFGNKGDTSGTGVAFSRNPATGEKGLYGEYLFNAQGEDVVAGIRTPKPISDLQKDNPEVYNQFVKVVETLENHYKDMQDMEFTIEHSKLWMLQTRNGKRTATAAVKIAVDMVKEKLLTEEEAVMRVGAEQLDQLLHPMLDPKANKKVIATGLPASPGAAVGKAVFSADVAEEWNKKGEKVMLVRIETSPEDIGGMDAAQGIITARGGMTSHAAVVARGMGRPCVSGSNDIKIDYAKKQFTTTSGAIVREGEWVSIDGAKGQIIEGNVPTVQVEMTGDFGTFMSWVDKARTMTIRANAETPRDAKQARDFGAEGIGLARTEHMFFDASRIQDMREMILADTLEGRRRALAKLLPHQKKDFKELYRVMDGLPVTVRLLDPPLHEFLPHTEAEMQELAHKMGVTVEKIKERAEKLHEFNPMLGHRGCRLAITYPEIAEMQTRAIIEAAIEVGEEGISVVPEIEVPLVGSKKEFDICKTIIDGTAQTVFGEKNKTLKYLVGTMIELPRACLLADEIAETAEFFGFGTNDLTQTTLGMSRDDTGAILEEYRAKGVYVGDPFATLDQEGVGQLVRTGCEKGRATRPNIKLGVCGEHGGDPESINFFQSCGMGYVSCSPFRVPIARLAAAQAAIKAKKGEKKAA
ncbi:MAG: pyruvate, phosphate dikinase [Lactobacillaceae bacterium]|jgi:pyruvate,orthophosphate dikinase|nr:pyruvate, phosphate dikinase [Lactobacillaceae bacterium]